MSVSSRQDISVIGLARERRQTKDQAQRQNARVSSDVAEVAKRPKKRPGRRERSSITTRRQAMLVGLEPFEAYIARGSGSAICVCNRGHCSRSETDLLAVVPAKAGTHNPRVQFARRKRQRTVCSATPACGYGPRPSPGRRITKKARDRARAS